MANISMNISDLSEDNSSTLDNFPMAQDNTKDSLDKEKEIFVQVVDDKDVRFFFSWLNILVIFSSASRKAAELF